MKVATILILGRICFLCKANGGAANTLYFLISDIIQYAWRNEAGKLMRLVKELTILLPCMYLKG